MKFNYSTRDLVIVAVIAAIAGVVNTGMGNVWAMANTALGPLGGALLQGSFMWAYILAVWLVRKPGVAIAVGVIESLVEVLLGNQAGIATLGWGISQGLAIEVVLLISGYKNWSMLAAMLCGAAASQFGTMWTALFYGWDPSTAGDVWAAVPINLVSGLVLSGLLGYLLFRALARTGLVRSATVQ